MWLTNRRTRSPSTAEERAVPEPQPQGLPSELLTSPEWQRACQQRDFASVFRLVKVKAGIYPSRVAALCGMTPSRVGEIMSGRRRLAHIDVIERVADGLRIPGAMLGLAHRPWEIPPPATTAQSPQRRSAQRTATAAWLRAGQQRSRTSRGTGRVAHARRRQSDTIDASRPQIIS
ncbi:helix-turn-helix domain-containing protein [Streptomyces sp. NPDC051217]|uniref:helix-turn-helix domain-containing protein n=1 Tax=Streptomyces sp. NPDC051217 TaxID=3365644 RepID=UPI0037933CB4